MGDDRLKWAVSRGGGGFSCLGVECGWRCFGPVFWLTWSVLD